MRESLPRVEERIGLALERAGSNARVTIVAVTKGHPPDAVRAAVEVGLADVGENRVVELEEKRAEVDVHVRWHLIGHLQRNKVRRALPLFHLVHSVDSLRLAEELSAEAERADVEVAALVQVNASGEVTKGGLSVEDGVDPIAQIATLPRLRVKGLMTMAPFTDDEAVVRRTFSSTRALFDACGAAVPEFEARHLSMGMSNDFEIAVEEGSTMVRLGTVLFGERP
ncbi:MAG: YggS family pyridoxal phosphate-dependent enzyme [Longimicrobiales bacterium]